MFILKYWGLNLEFFKSRGHEGGSLVQEGKKGGGKTETKVKSGRDIEIATKRGRKDGSDSLEMHYRSHHARPLQF